MTIGRGYDPGQVIEASFDPLYEAIDVRNIGGSLVPDLYDEIDLTYVVSGNGVGQIATATYKLQTLNIATLTLTYDSSNRISKVVRS
jgi:hypothetical protein